MAAPQNFRTAFSGFHKEDVVQYLEYINNKYTNHVNQLTAEAQELRTQLEAMGNPSEEQAQLLAQVQQERDALAAQLEEERAARIALEEKYTQLQAQQVTIPEEPVPAKEAAPLASEELEAYRRAERMEREAKERADLVYYQANNVLTETTTKVEAIAGEITEMADQVMSQLTQMQMLVSSSKHALQDASSLLGIIRPNK